MSASKAKLRRVEEIDEQSDLIYCLSWSEQAKEWWLVARSRDYTKASENLHNQDSLSMHNPNEPRFTQRKQRNAMPYNRFNQRVQVEDCNKESWWDKIDLDIVLDELEHDDNRLDAFDEYCKKFVMKELRLRREARAELTSLNSQVHNQRLHLSPISQTSPLLLPRRAQHNNPSSLAITTSSTTRWKPRRRLTTHPANLTLGTSRCTQALCPSIFTTTLKMQPQFPSNFFDGARPCRLHPNACRHLRSASNSRCLACEVHPRRNDDESTEHFQHKRLAHVVVQPLPTTRRRHARWNTTRQLVSSSLLQPLINNELKSLKPKPLS